MPWLTSCAPSQPLRVGIHHWVGYESLNLAREFNWLSTDISFQDGSSAADSINGLISGQLDAACLTLDEVLRVREAGIPLTVALVFDVSAGADIVISKPDIQALSDLAGKRIGAEKSAVGALMVSQLLMSAGLSHSDVEIIDCPLEQQLTLWLAGDVDAMVSYEPTASLLKREGGRLLFDSRKMPETIIDVLAVRSDLSRNKKSELRALIAGHFQGLNHIQSNHQDACYRISSYQEVSPKEVARALSGIRQPSLVSNWEYLDLDSGHLLHIAESVSEFLYQSGLLERKDTLDNLITPHYLPKG